MGQINKVSEEMPDLAPDLTDRVNDYAAKVADVFATTFKADGRFPDWQQPMNRFTEAVSAVVKYGISKFSAVYAAHNEMCIADALLKNENPRFARLDYEPPLDGSAKSIDFRATTEDSLTVYVDVKTIQPEDIDKRDQFEKAKDEKWFPDNMVMVFNGSTWHDKFTARSRMLEYTLELEGKIADAGLAGHENTFVILALCGDGFRWHQSELEDFVEFYRTGRHRGDDFSVKMESHYIERKQITLAGTVTRFAYMQRSQRDTKYTLNGNVRPPRNYPS